MKKLKLLNTVSDNTCRTLCSTYGKRGGYNIFRNDGLVAPFVLQIHYDKVETTRKLRPIEKEESE